MKFITPLLLTLLTLLTSVTAIKNTTRAFHLKTRLIKPFYQRARFDKLYVYSYHTGAGLGDACLDTRPSSNGNGAAFKNGTNIIFNLSTDYPWGLTQAYTGSYNIWSSVTIDVGTGTDGWGFNKNGLTRPKDESWGGWMVCDWAHGVRQLFWRNKSFGNNLPRSCANVEVYPEYF